MDRGTKFMLAACFVVFSVTLYLSPQVYSTKPARPPGEANADEVRLMVFGDYGVGGRQQQLVASQLGRIAAAQRPQAVLSAGDSFYMSGITSDKDPQLQEKFEQVYNMPSLQVPWLITPGNHDCWGSVDAMIRYAAQSKQWLMPGRYYLRDFALGPDDQIRVVVLDGCLLVCGEMKNYRCDETLRHSVSPQLKQAQNEWMLEALRPARRWKIVMSHWPAFSWMGNGPTAEVVNELVPLLKEHGVHLYISGHDHSLQHIRLLASDFPQFIISGGGGYDLHPALKPEADASLNSEAMLAWGEATHGFFTVAATRQTLHIQAFGLESAEPLYQTRVAQPVPHGEAIYNPQF